MYILRYKLNIQSLFQQIFIKCTEKFYEDNKVRIESNKISKSYMQNF